MGYIHKALLRSLLLKRVVSSLQSNKERIRTRIRKRRTVKYKYQSHVQKFHAKLCRTNSRFYELK